MLNEASPNKDKTAAPVKVQHQPERPTRPNPPDKKERTDKKIVLIFLLI